MSPEKTYYQYLWWVLTKIKRESLSTPKGKPIEYEFSHLVAAGVPNNKTEQNILEQLDQEGAIHIYELQPADWRGGRGWCHLEIFEITFKRIYEETESIINGDIPKAEAKEDKEQSEEDIFKELKETLPKNTNVAISILDRRYNNIINLSSPSFFIGLADYGKYLIEFPEMEFVVKLLQFYQQRDEKKIKELEKLLNLEIDKVSKELLKTIEDAGIKQTNVENAVNEFKAFEEGRIQSTATEEESRYDFLTQIIDALYYNGYKKLVIDLIKENDERKHISDYKISGIYWKYQDALKNFRKLKETAIWGSWHKIMTVYLVVHRYGEEMERMAGNDYIWYRMNFSGLREEFDKVQAGDPNANQVFFKKDDLAFHASRVHQLAIELLSKVASLYEPQSEEVVGQKDSETSSPAENQDRILTNGGLTINLSQSTIKYKNIQKDLPIGNNDIKLLIQLMDNKRVNEYAEIAKKLKLNSYHDGVENKDVSREVQFIKRDLNDYLKKELGMPETEINKLIMTIKKVGYKIKTDDSKIT